MNLIGCRVKFRLIEQWGTIFEKYTGKLYVAVDSGHGGTRNEFIAVDFYIVEFDEGIFHFECSEIEDVDLSKSDSEVISTPRWKR